MNSIKTILIINQYYPPDRSATAGILGKIVQHISMRFGVVVLTGRPSYLSLESQKWKFLKTFKNGNVKIMRVGSTAFTRYNITKRIFNYLSYTAISLPVALLIKADVIMSMTDPPLAGVIGAIAAKIKNKPFVYYIQDLHPDMAIASGMIKQGPFARLWHAIHMFVLKSSNRLIVIGEDMKDRILKKGIPGNKISVIRHGTSKYHCQQDVDLNLIRKIRKNFQFTFMHSGNIGNYGAWEQLINAIKKINNSKIGFIFVGEGQKKLKLMQLCNGVENILFLPYQPRERIASVLAAADVQIITIRKNIEGLVVPSKIYPILGANKPILGICPKESDTARIIDQFQCGLIADPGSTDSISGAITQFYECKDKLADFEKNSLLAAKFYSQDKLLDELSTEISFLI